MSNRKTPIEGGNYEKWGSLSRAILTACRSQDSSNRSRSRSWREFCQLEVSCSRTFQRQNLTLKRSLSVNDYRKCQYMKLTLLWFIYIRNAVLSPSETKPSQNLKIRKKLRVVIISEEMVRGEATRVSSSIGQLGSCSSRKRYAGDESEQTNECRKEKNPIAKKWMK